MKTLAGTTNRLVLIGTSLVALIAAISFAQPGGTNKQPKYDKQKNGIRLLFGGGKGEGRDKTSINEAKLTAALASVDDTAFYVKYYNGASSVGAGWPKGHLPDPELTDISQTREIGGATEPVSGTTDQVGIRTVGNATQCVTFQSTADLTAFTDALK